MEKMSVHVNVRMSKNMSMPTKVRVYICTQGTPIAEP